MGKHSATAEPTSSGSLKVQPSKLNTSAEVSPAPVHSEFPQTRSPAANLHKAQFGSHAKEYAGKRRKTPDGTVGKDMGYSMGPAKKPDYLGAHRAEPGRGRHAKTYDANAEINDSNLKQNPTGKHRTEAGKGKHAKYYNPERDLSISMNKDHPKNSYVGKHAPGYKAPRNSNFDLKKTAHKVHKFIREVENIASRHEGKNAARLKEMEKAA